MDLVTEMAEEYNRRNGEKKQIQYSTEAALARSVLDEEIVSHVKKCFTKNGMKEFRLGRRKNVVTKRKDVIKIPSEWIVGNENVDSLDQDEVGIIEKEKSYEEFDENFLDEAVEEQVPSEDEIRLAQEEKIFGGQLPKVVRRLKPPRKGVSDRVKGRGGRNEFTKKNVPESLVLGAVDYMLASKSSRNGENPEKLQQPTISLSGLFKKSRSRRKRINIDFDDLSDDEDEDYKAPSIYNRKVDRPDEENKRKSNRLCEKQSRVDSGEYFDDENHDLGVNQAEHEQLPHVASYVGSYTITPEFKAKFSSGQWVVVSGAEMPGNKQQSKESSELCEDQTNSVDWTARKPIANVCENYLKRPKCSAKLGTFDQVFARKKHYRKVMQVVETQKKRAITHPVKKYKGFRKEVVTKQEFTRRYVLKGKNLGVRKFKKAKVSKEEDALMKKLLVIGESAVAESSSQSGSDFSQVDSNTSMDTDAIEEFEEVHNFSQESDFEVEFDALLELN